MLLYISIQYYMATVNNLNFSCIPEIEIDPEQHLCVIESRSVSDKYSENTFKIKKVNLIRKNYFQCFDKLVLTREIRDGTKII